MRFFEKNIIAFSIIIALIFCVNTQTARSQNFRTVENKAFKRGEKLKFRVYFQSVLTGKLTAGNAVMEVKNTTPIKNNRSTYHIKCVGKTKGLIHAFYKIKEDFDTYIDDKSFFSWQFNHYAQENKYRKKELVIFNQTDHTASSTDKKNMNIPENTQDILSAFYFSRTFDSKNIQLGDEVEIPFFLDDSVYTSKIIFDGCEEIKTKLGIIKCLRFKPMVVVGTVFSDPYPAVLWISDDENKLPILAESKISLGRVKMELIDYSGLANPFDAMIEYNRKKKGK